VAAELLHAAGARVVAVLAIFKQGEAPEKVPVPFSYLGKLPFFSKFPS
jgi:adenine/guanine phosphoribosyltransferase-like PRPP-binding protein